MSFKVFNSKNYENTEKNNGDCIVFSLDGNMYVYDCGCTEHAERVIEYANSNGFSKFDVILSHNDSDHFDGINYLVEEGKVDKVITTLLLKHKDDILDRIDDGRRTRDSVSEAILKLYDNIASLGGRVKLIDAYEFENTANLKFVGPSYPYMIDAVAKRLDGREGNELDGDTAVNATSLQFSVDLGNGKVLLTGDATYEALKENLAGHDFIQLPHHGKPKTAEKIFEHNNQREDRNEITYFVSDNTGNTNGGSEELNTRGHKVKNTRTTTGDIEISSNNRNLNIKSNLGGC